MLPVDNLSEVVHSAGTVDSIGLTILVGDYMVRVANGYIQRGRLFDELFALTCGMVFRLQGRITM